MQSKWNRQDPSTEVQEVLIACMNWNMATCKSKIPEADLPGLQQKAVDLLDLLQKNLPDKRYVLVHTRTYQYILVCTGMY